MNEIDKLKRRVESAYGFEIKKWKIIKDEKNSSIVIKIITNKEEKYALKSLYVTPKRQSFIVSSERMLAERGVNLAKPISTMKGNLYLLYKQFPYVLYEWIEGESSKLNNQNDLEAIVEVMARFHHASRELQYSTEVKIYEHRNWRQEYRERLNTFESWIKAHKSPTNKNEKIINRYIPFFKEMAQKALLELKNSSYDDYINGSSTIKSLVHGDLHHNNVIHENSSSKALIDFEDIRYDLPSKDLMRIYSMYTKKHSFKQESFRSMMNIYERNHLLSSDVKQLVFIDLLFPHIFERLLRKKKYIGMNSQELEHRIKQEKEKASYIYRHYFLEKQPQKLEG